MITSRELITLTGRTGLVVHVAFCFLYVTSLGLLTVISVQRCLSVLFPIWCKVCRPLSTVVCTLLWGLAFLTTTLLYSFSGDRYNSESLWKGIERLFPFITLPVVGIFTPVMILLVQTQRRPSQWCQHSSRVFVIVLVSVLVFIVRSLPLGIVWTLQSWSGIRADDVVINLTRFTSSLSSSANPLILFLVGRGRGGSLRAPLRTVLSRAWQEDSELGSKETPSTITEEMGL
ncbi:PREDICTED: mas-related G-protein coupled receptor member D-like [Elephantulus edwardii]|uniref:mas-related G-protein coupled receptor member D-like n=1 Tax=Elephantulus edwardii TaxID=28737 RepID=UPI0003F0D951|nr:PREDICTED: mas-related G-protein coupled receptor member D-like [Elephantulus edwardii]